MSGIQSQLQPHARLNEILRNSIASELQLPEFYLRVGFSLLSRAAVSRGRVLNVLRYPHAVGVRMPIHRSSRRSAACSCYALAGAIHGFLGSPEDVATRATLIDGKLRDPSWFFIGRSRTRPGFGPQPR